MEISSKLNSNCLSAATILGPFILDVCPLAVEVCTWRSTSTSRLSLIWLPIYLIHRPLPQPAGRQDMEIQILVDLFKVRNLFWSCYILQNLVDSLKICIYSNPKILMTLASMYMKVDINLEAIFDMIANLTNTGWGKKNGQSYI